MGGDHHPKIPEVPDWRTYRIEDVPQLRAVERALKSHNLKNPWLRNEVWRFVEYNEQPFRLSAKYILTLGFKYGLAAAVLTTVVEKAIFPWYKREGEEAHH